MVKAQNDSWRDIPKTSPGGRCTRLPSLPGCRRRLITTLASLSRCFSHPERYSHTRSRMHEDYIEGGLVITSRLYHPYQMYFTCATHDVHIFYNLASFKKWVKVKL